MSEDGYRRRYDRITNRNINFKKVLGFKSPEHFSVFNSAIKRLEQSRGKKYTNKDYETMIDIYSNNVDFNNQCLNYFQAKGVITKPCFVRVDRWSSYDIKDIILKNQSHVKKKKEYFKVDPFRSIAQNMKNSVGYSFLKKNFSDPDKVRYLLLSIKSNGGTLKYDFDSEDKKKYLLRFYYDDNFNKFYNMFLLTENKFIKPSLDHLIPRSRGGSSNLDNLHFISYLENIAKSDMTWQEWVVVKNNLHKFMGFEDY